MITAVIDAGQHYCQAVSDLWQWDYGQTLRIQGVKIPAAVEVQFSTTERIGETVTRIGVTQEGVTEVPIPDALLDGAWTEISVDPMNEIMVYGCYILADNSNKQTSENRQLSLFRMSPQARYAGGDYWLRNYANATEFTLVSYYGDASKDAATSTYGIRPVFAITGENR